MRSSGAFVYQGSGKKQDPDAPPEQRLCVNQVVATQKCMARHGSRQDRCKAEVDAWKKCVRRVKEAHAAAVFRDGKSM